MGGPWVAHMLHFTRHRSLNGPYSLRCIARGIAPPLEELKRARKSRASPSTAEARLARLRASLPIGHACRTLFEEEEP